MCWKWCSSTGGSLTENLDVSRRQFLEGRLEQEVVRLHVVPDGRGVLLDVRPPAFEVRCLLAKSHIRSEVRCKHPAGQQHTLVAITI